MALKPIKRADMDEESPEEELEVDEEEVEPDNQEQTVQQIKKAVTRESPKPRPTARPQPQPEPEQEQAEQPELTREEVLDMINGHLNRAYQLVQALK